MKQFLLDHRLLGVALAGSLLGHLCLGLVSSFGDQDPKLHDRQSGLNSIKVNLVAARSPVVKEFRQKPIPKRKPKPAKPQHHPTDLSAVMRRDMDVNAPMAPKLVPTRNKRTTPDLVQPEPTDAPPKKVDRTATETEVALAEYKITIPESKSPRTLVAKQSTGADVPPSFLTRIDPVYPPDLLLSGIEGRVNLLVTIGADGRVVSLSVKSSSGHEAMDKSAVQAVRRWQFVPAKRGGVPVAKEVVVPVTFRIRR